MFDQRDPLRHLRSGCIPDVRPSDAVTPLVVYLMQPLASLRFYVYVRPEWSMIALSPAVSEERLAVSDIIGACGIGGLDAVVGCPLADIRGRIDLPIVVESQPSISGTT